MTALSKRDKHLVSFGAAIGCNCIPCTVYHLKECIASGVTDEELAEALEAANAVKQVPANNVTQTALRQLKRESETAVAADCGCGEKSAPCGCQ